MWQRLMGAVFVLTLTATTAAACKHEDGAIKEDETDKPKPKKKPEPPVKKLTEPKSHRSAKVTCPSADTKAPATVTFGPRPITPPGAPCSSKADCKEEKNGRCALGHCTYDGCYDEKDCGNKVCACEQEGKRGYYCKGGDCAADSDCGEQGYCSPTYGMSCGAFTGIIGFYCHTAQDECTNDDECVKGTDHGYCAFDPEKKHWRCGYGHCVG